jgi:hypothetical protein
MSGVEVGAGSGGRRWRALVGAALAAALALVVVPSASAAVSGTVAPIGSASSGDYLVTIEGEAATPHEELLIELSGEEPATGVAPSSCTYGQPVAGTVIGCPAPSGGAKLQLCYHGPAAASVIEFYASVSPVPLKKGGAVASCPVPGFKASSGSGGLSLGKAKVDPSSGSAKLPVTVPGAGTVRLSGPGVKAATATAKGAGKVTLTVKASGGKAKQLSEDGKVTLNVTVTFTPSKGKASTASATVKLVEN